MTVMRVLLLISLSLVAATSYAADTNGPTRLQRGETWYSASRLERIAKAYAKEQKIEFRFEETQHHVLIKRRGTNTVATICFASAMGQPFFEVEVAPSGAVITNNVGIAECGTGRKR